MKAIIGETISLLRKYPDPATIWKYLLTYYKFKNYTMVPRPKYLMNLILASKFSRVPGTIVECGTWKGGMIGGIASTIGNDREYFLFDSFEGLPPAKSIDGQAALQWQSLTDSPYYYDNCRASEADARKAMLLSGATDFQIVKGWFQNTLKEYPVHKPIAILHLDGDWFDSTLQCLDHLFPLVEEGGLVILDDYCAWEGCSKAVHKFLSDNCLPYRICQFMDSVSYLVKVSA